MRNRAVDFYFLPRLSSPRDWHCCSRRRPTSRRYTGRNLPRLRHSSTRPAMLHAAETAQLECRMGRGQVESGGDAAPHRPARCGHRLSHRDDTARLTLPGIATPSAPRPTGGNPAGRDRRADRRSCGGPGSPGGTRMIWPRSAPARAICVRHNPDRCGRGNDHRRLLVPNPARGWVHAGTGTHGRTTRSIWTVSSDC